MKETWIYNFTSLTSINFLLKWDLKKSSRCYVLCLPSNTLAESSRREGWRRAQSWVTWAGDMRQRMDVRKSSLESCYLPTPIQQRSSAQCEAAWWTDVQAAHATSSKTGSSAKEELLRRVTSSAAQLTSGLSFVDPVRRLSYRPVVFQLNHFNTFIIHPCLKKYVLEQGCQTHHHGYH